MPNNKPDTFKAKMERLEQIVEWFESEQSDLDEAISKFEEGNKLIAELKEHLSSAENTVQKIKKSFSESN